jgi:hypothetical protein
VESRNSLSAEVIEAASEAIWHERYPETAVSWKEAVGFAIDRHQVNQVRREARAALNAAGAAVERDSSVGPAKDVTFGNTMAGGYPFEVGKLVREVWIAWAREQPDVSEHPSWLVPWAELPERDREVDRRIEAAIVLRESVMKGTGIPVKTLGTSALNRGWHPLTDGWPSGEEMIRQLLRALGEFDGARAESPKSVWDGALATVRLMAAEIERLESQIEAMTRGDGDPAQGCCMDWMDATRTS